METRFNQAPLPVINEKYLRDGEYIFKDENGRDYLCWHDLIDIRVPLFDDPSILLTPRVPTPLHHRNPRSILTEIDGDWWNRTRQRVYSSSDDHCRCCGVHKSQQLGWPKNIDAHELYDIDYRTGEVRLKAIVPLCASGCHRGVHFGRLTAKYQSGDIDERTYYRTISHCNTILSDAGLPKKNWNVDVNDNIYNVPWNQWKLILTIEGKDKEFYSLYKDEEDLRSHY